VSGNFDTNFVKHHFKPEYLDQSNELEQEIAAIVSASLVNKSSSATTEVKSTQSVRSKWRDRSK